MTGWLAAAVVAVVLGAVLPRFADGWGLSGRPEPGDERHQHAGPLPRVGGMAVAAGAVVGLSIGGHADWLHAVAVAPLLMGLHDDLRRSDARLRLLGIIGIAWAAVSVGARADVWLLPGGAEVALGAAAVPLSMLWIVGVVVAFDFLDGLDGLAGGVALFALAGFGAAGSAGAWPVVGALAGFLFHNLQGRIQLGDHGSNLVGYLVAVSALGVGGGEAVPLPAAGLVLGVPILDAAGTMFRRARRGGGMFVGERGHLHHRLADGRWGARGAVAVLWAATVLGIAAAALTLDADTAPWGLGLAVVVAMGLLASARSPSKTPGARAGGPGVES